MVKANNIEIPQMGEDKVKKPTKAKSLLDGKDMLAKFGKIDVKLAEFEEISLKIKVIDNDSLVVAENHSSRIQQIINGVEQVRVLMKGPYFETGKAIDAYAKSLNEPLERAKLRLNAHISSYKSVQIAQERMRIEKEKLEREQKDQKKNEEIEKLSRIKKQLYARIYGGVYYLNDGTRKATSGCLNTDDCNNLIQFIDERFPDPSSFIYLKVELENTKSIGMDLLIKHKANLISFSSSDPKSREDAFHAINTAKTNAEVEAVEEIETFKHEMQKESASIIRQDTKDLKNANKGVREIVKFVVEDQIIVPVDFKEVSDNLINIYIRNNSDKIKIALKEGTQPIPGINFYVDSKFVTSG